MSSFHTRLATKYAVEAKAPEETALMRALRRYVIQASKGEIPLEHCPHALYDAVTIVDKDEAKEHHDNLKKISAHLKAILECLDKAQKSVQQEHVGAVLQKGKNYL